MTAGDNQLLLKKKSEVRCSLFAWLGQQGSVRWCGVCLVIFVNSSENYYNMPLPEYLHWWERGLVWKECCSKSLVIVNWPQNMQLLIFFVTVIPSTLAMYTISRYTWKSYRRQFVTLDSYILSWHSNSSSPVELDFRWWTECACFANVSVDRGMPIGMATATARKFVCTVIDNYGGPQVIYIAAMISKL